MIKWAKISNPDTGICDVGLGTNSEFYASIGMTEMDVKQSDVDNCWYVADKCPMKSEVQKIEEAKKAKIEANQVALDNARSSHVFTVEIQGQQCDFDTTSKTQADLNSAAISASMGQPWLWTTNNRISLMLTAEDIQTISATYMTVVNNDIKKWTYFDELIENATTLEEVEAIRIDYTIAWVTLTINTTPKSAKVTINDEVTKEATLITYQGEVAKFDYKVEAKDYITKEDSIELVESKELSVALDKLLTDVTFTINATPNDAKVTINGEERTTHTVQHWKKELVTFNYSVEAEGYKAVTGTEEISASKELDVVLEAEEAEATPTEDNGDTNE